MRTDLLKRVQEQLELLKSKEGATLALLYRQSARIYHSPGTQGPLSSRWQLSRSPQSSSITSATLLNPPSGHDRLSPCETCQD